MSYNYILSKTETKKCEDQLLYLNAYVVTRIVYELIKIYMTNNSPESCGVILAQKYDPDYTKSDILLDIAYNWKTKEISKVPAIFVQREDMNLRSPTMGQDTHINSKTGAEKRLVINTLPITITCVAAEPIAVVENLAEYVKQPLLYFRKEVQVDYGIRQFKLDGITKPKLLAEGKNNFLIELKMTVTFDDNWKVSRNSLVLRRIGIELFDKLIAPIDAIQTIVV